MPRRDRRFSRRLSSSRRRARGLPADPEWLRRHRSWLAKPPQAAARVTPLSDPAGSPGDLSRGQFVPWNRTNLIELRTALALPRPCPGERSSREPSRRGFRICRSRCWKDDATGYAGGPTARRGLQRLAGDALFPLAGLAAAVFEPDARRV